MTSPNLHVWQVAFGSVVDPTLTQEQAIQQVFLAQEAKDEEIRRLSEELSKALWGQKNNSTSQPSGDES